MVYFRPSISILLIYLLQFYAFQKEKVWLWFFFCGQSWQKKVKRNINWNRGSRIFLPPSPILEDGGEHMQCNMM
jgi:hypothetical protein